MLAGCQTTQSTHSGFTSSKSVAQQRALDSRLFETDDEATVLNAAVGLLQDLGYKLEETDLNSGLVTGSKGQGQSQWSSTYDIRITITTTPINTGGVVVRATFQEIRRGASVRYSSGNVVSDPVIYRDFFDKLSQSLFLEAHNI